MWRFAALMVVALASSAHGGGSLSFASPYGSDPPETGPFPLNVMMDVGSADLVTGVTFAVSTNRAGTLRLTGRELMNPVLTDPTTSNGTLLSAANSLLNPKNVKDIGVGSSDGVTPTEVGKQLLMTLTFTIEPGHTLTYPTTLSIVGAGAAEHGVWSDPDLNTHELPVSTIQLIVPPEPASLALVACGVGLLVRRRRRQVR